VIAKILLIIFMMMIMMFAGWLVDRCFVSWVSPFNHALGRFGSHLCTLGATSGSHLCNFQVCQNDVI
jgi:hypothetical protein